MAETKWTGALRIFQRRPDSEAHLVLQEPTEFADRYGVIFIQFPEMGRPSGGSAWCSSGSEFRDPQNAEEHLWVQQYLTAKRVIDLEAELAEAVANRDAVQRYAKLLGGDPSVTDHGESTRKGGGS